MPLGMIIMLASTPAHPMESLLIAASLAVDVLILNNITTQTQNHAQMLPVTI